MGTRLISIILTFLPILICKNAIEEGLRVHNLQKQITSAAKMDFSNYKLYPFAINKKQEFFLNFRSQEEVKAQVMVYWIDTNTSELIFPLYQQAQCIKLDIIDVNNSKIVQSRRFNFQSGVSFKTQAHHSYKIVFQNAGKRNKMIQLAISQIQPSKLTELVRYNSTETTKKIMQLGIQIQSQLTYLTRRASMSQISAKGIYSYMNASLQNLLAFTLWQVCLLCLMVFCQIFLFQRIIRSNWSFV